MNRISIECLEKEVKNLEEFIKTSEECIKTYEDRIKHSKKIKDKNIEERDALLETIRKLERE